MSWNYRVIEFVTVHNEPWRAIHEVYYDAEGNPNGYGEEPAVVIADGDELDNGLGKVLDMMRLALSKPVLVHTDFFKKSAS